jgi:hypothetical protein
MFVSINGWLIKKKTITWRGLSMKDDNISRRLTLPVVLGSEAEKEDHKVRCSAVLNKTTKTCLDFCVWW